MATGEQEVRHLMGGANLQEPPMVVPRLLSPRPEGGAEPTFLLTPPAVWAALGRRVPALMQGSTRRAGVMTDVHRRFLQLLMTHGVLEECDIKRLQRHCYKVHDRAEKASDNRQHLPWHDAAEVPYSKLRRSSGAGYEHNKGHQGTEQQRRISQGLPRLEKSNICS
uniref:NSE1 homolog, SMC5-SMC6 complex component n=1 Tax=Sus scrofa TaxID=9823 RepID=A0A8D0X0A2_PIG